MKINRRNFIKLLASVVIAKLPLKTISKTDKFASSILNNKENRQNKPKVIRIYNPKATFWDYKTKPYTNFIN